MPNIYEWLNREKSRYYKVAIQETGKDGIILAHDWGSCTSNRGGKKNLFVQTQEDAQKFIVKMMKRRKSRGYELVAPCSG